MQGWWLINRISIADSVEWRAVNLDVAESDVVIVKHQERVNAVFKKRVQAAGDRLSEYEYLDMHV